MNSNEMITETYEQDFWELNGRVKALVGYINKTSYLEKEIILTMLGYNEGE